jgi:hypothetical protein
MQKGPIVAADVSRQATFLKQPLKDGESVVFPGGRKRFASEQKATGVIGDGKGITVLAIAQQELAFVIGAAVARAFSERPNWDAHASRSRCSSPAERAVDWHSDRDIGFGR